jgi:hypothetical protein
MGNLDFIEDKSVEPINLGSGEPLPPGMYLCVLTNSEIAQTSKGDGVILKCEFTVFDEPHTGRIIYSNFNVANPNPKAEQIGRGMLSSFARAAGLLEIPNDSSDLHDKPVILKLVIKEASGDYAARNEVKGFFSKDTKKPVKKVESLPASVADDMPDFLK